MSLTVASLVQTTTRDLEDLVNVPKSARLDRLRATISQSKRRLVALQTELSNLKSAELFVLQKMNRYVKLKHLEQFYPADRFMLNGFRQAMKPLENTASEDNSEINQTRNQLLKGLEPLEAERNRIAADILQVSTEIIKHRQALSDAQNMLKTGSDVSLAKDAIAKREFSEIYMLYEVHKKYRELSTDERGNRLYNSDGSTIASMSRLKDQFKELAGRNPFVTSSQLVLDYSDPGSDENEKSLMNMLDRTFTVLGNQSGVSLNDEKLQKYSSQMVSNMNDPYKSQNVARQDDPKNAPPEDKALKNETKSPSKLVGFVNKVVTTPQKGVKIYMSWDQTSATNAIQSWFERQVSGLNQGMPVCQKKDSPASEKDLATNSQDQAESSAAENFAKQFAETKKAIDPQIFESRLTNLMDELTTAIDSTGGTNVSASSFLIIGEMLYSGSNLYQARVISASSGVANYLMDMKTNGTITDADYNSYMNGLTSEMAMANPPLAMAATNY
jgi:hypothetical protein